MNRSTLVFLLLLIVPFFTFSQTTPCVDGRAGVYPCNRVSLVAHVNPQDLFSEFIGEWANDIWGWTDPSTSIEYVIIGVPNGTTFVDISNPENPIVVGFLPSHNGTSSPWRDIKVYENHAFIVSEANGHGMQVFDLTRLRTDSTEPETFTADAHYDGISNAHNIVINTETGFAYATGATRGGTCSQGGLHIINIQDPLNPSYEACFDNDGYTHDAQCVIYNGPDSRYTGSEICFNSNEDAVTIADVSDKSNIQQLSTKSYANASYTHQGWLTEDHQYFLANDELDELERGNRTRTLIWDVRDLEDPILIGEYFADNFAVDHNLYINDGLVYESNYRSGLRILQASTVADGTISEVAYFDSFPSDDLAETSGNWSNYPFFESGIIAISDMDRGLFLLKPSLDFYITNNIQDFVACEGEEGEISISTQGEVQSYQWQIDSGDGFQNISDNDQFSGSSTNSLLIDSYTTDLDGQVVRCLVSDGNEEVYSNEAIIKVIALPVGDIELIPDDLRLDVINASLNAEDYSWDFGNGSPIITNKTPRHFYEDYGTYTVTFMAINECGTDVIETNLTLAITSSKDILRDVSIYPVPASREVSVKNISEIGKVKEVLIVHSSGKVMSTEEFQLTRDNMIIPLDNLKNGLYFLRIAGEAATLNSSFIVSK